MPSSRDSLLLLQPWSAWAEAYWWNDPARPGLGCFGTGYNSWGVQTNQKYLSALAVLAADPGFEADAAGLSREQVADRALASLRFSLASHLSGDHHCADGTQWGHTWISALGVERMLHGVRALGERLTPADQEALRRMVASEATALLSLPVTATLWAHEGGNRPESNLWNGALLFRAAQMVPEAAEVPAWLEQAHWFLLNGISVPADGADQALAAGRPRSEWHLGPNFFPHYALDHHGYLNVGYMVICLSQIAFLHFACREHGWEPPAGLYQHAAELWGLVKRLIFADGRLARIGGDSRLRYCYCQDYLLPTLLWAEDYLGDPHAAKLEAGQLQIIGHERDLNADGSFLSRRLAELAATNPYYYTRLESDKACALGMNLYWRRVLGLGGARGPATNGVAPCGQCGNGHAAPGPGASGTPPPGGDVGFEACVAGSWEEPQHGAMLHRSPRRLASWSWRAWDAPQGMCLPPNDGHLAEWCANLGGEVLLVGEQGRRTVLRHDQSSFPGGFLTTGAMSDSGKAYLAEGWTGSDPVVHQYAVAALPDDRTLLVLEYCRVRDRTYLAAVKGLKLNIPNDLFNEGRRTYHAASGSHELAGDGAGVTDLVSPWANVADRLGVVGVYGGTGWSVYQAGVRRASGYGRSLYYDELCYPCQVGLWDVNPETVVLDCGTAVLAGAARDETARAAAHAAALETGNETLRAVQVTGAGGAWYLLVANFGAEAATFIAPDEGIWHEVTTGRPVAGGGAWELAAGAALLAVAPSGPGPGDNS